MALALPGEPRNLHQVYHSSAWVDHIFNAMGDIAPLAHIKDLKLSNGLVLHIDQELPGGRTGPGAGAAPF